MPEQLLPSNQILQDIDTASQYLQYLFKAKLAVPDGDDGPSVPPPSGLSQALIVEYQWIAEILNKAYRSPSKSYIYSPLVVILMGPFQLLFLGVQGNMPRNYLPGPAAIPLW
jgi:hypothetical protein